MAKLLLLAVTACLALVGVSAQRPSTTSICDYYASSQSGSSDAAKQYNLVYAVVSRAAVGDAGATPAVTGLLNVEALKPFFNGSINYRATGSAPDYTTDMGALQTLTGKLVSFFGNELGCTGVGSADFPATAFSSDLTAVHKNMPITQTVFTLFNSQVTKSLQSFGVAQADVDMVTGLLAAFNRGSFTTAGAPVSPSDATNIVCNDPYTCSCGSTNYVGLQCRPKMSTASTRPSTTTVCDYYTAHLGASPDSPQDEAALVSAIVVRAVTGGSGNGVTVEGILNVADLKPFFNSSINYRYTGSPNGATAAPNFYTNTAAFNALAGKLVGFFGGALGCTAQGNGNSTTPNTDFPAYTGATDLTAIHKNMPITLTIFTEFNTQITQTAKSFGVSDADVAALAAILASFNRGSFTADGTPVKPEYALDIICNDAATCPCTSDAYDPDNGCKPVDDGGDDGAASALQAFTFASVLATLLAMVVRQ